MATYVKGDKVANATSYKLFEGDTEIAEASEINFNVSELIKAEGEHTLHVKAYADGYSPSDASNTVKYTVSAGGGTGETEGDVDDGGDTGESTGGNTGTGEKTTANTTTGAYIAIADGTITSSASWIYTDLVAIDSLTNNENGYCTSNLQGHAKVANIAYYSSADLSSYISGVQYTAGEAKQYTVEEIKTSAPSGATYVNFSTRSGQAPLEVTILQ